ncbi:MAG TPA: hypothetical protein VN426_07395 [Syntrophomonadaceae bacterium]|nr:hypothetical protein [Syntrophomonadaceae bacterium]
MKKKIAIFLILVMALTLIAGCGSEKTVVTRQGNDGSKSEVNVPDKKGGDVSLPEGYPKELVPIFAGSQIELADKNEENGKTTYLISLSSSKSVEDVFNYYKDVLKDAQNFNSSKTEDISSVAGVKNNLQISVMISPDDKKTSFQIAIAPKK